MNGRGTGLVLVIKTSKREKELRWRKRERLSVIVSKQGIKLIRS